MGSIMASIGPDRWWGDQGRGQGAQHDTVRAESSQPPSGHDPRQREEDQDRGSSKTAPKEIAVVSTKLRYCGAPSRGVIWSRPSTAGAAGHGDQVGGEEQPRPEQHLAAEREGPRIALLAALQPGRHERHSW